MDWPSGPCPQTFEAVFCTASEITLHGQYPLRTNVLESLSMKQPSFWLIFSSWWLICHECSPPPLPWLGIKKIATPQPVPSGSESTQILINLQRLRGGRASGLGQQLQSLQYVMKKDPEGYAAELDGQVATFQERLKAWESSPLQHHQELGELAIFLAHMSPLYPDRVTFLPGQVMQRLRDNSTAMLSEVRTKFCESLTLMCAKKQLPLSDLCSTFFRLFQVPDKKLRSYLYASCLNAIKRFNAKSVDQRVNRQIQRDLAEWLHGQDGPSGRMAINIFMELFRRRMWDDDHVVNIIGAACFSRQNKVRGSAVNFLLGIDDELDDGGDDFGLGGGDDQPAKKRIKRIKLAIVKKHKKKALRKALKEQAKEDERVRLEGPASVRRRREAPSFSALDRLHDPQAFAERMVLLMNKWSTTLNFDHKLLMMELVSRVIENHRFFVTEYFDLIMRYLQPGQQGKLPAAFAPIIPAKGGHCVVSPSPAHTALPTLPLVSPYCSPVLLHPSKSLSVSQSTLVLLHGEPNVYV